MIIRQNEQGQPHRQLFQNKMTNASGGGGWVRLELNETLPRKVAFD